MARSFSKPEVRLSDGERCEPSAATAPVVSSAASASIVTAPVHFICEGSERTRRAPYATLSAVITVENKRREVLIRCKGITSNRRVSVL